MTRRQCRQADVWMAAFKVDQLDTADKIRLQEHLQSCDACRRRARGVASLVSILQDEAITLRGDRLDQMWRKVDTAVGRQPTHSALADKRRSVMLQRRWRLGLIWGAAALGAMTVGLGLFLSRPAQGPTATSGTTRPLARSRWQVIAVSDARLSTQKMLTAGDWVGPGARIAVGPAGRAVLASPSAMLILENHTRLVLTTASGLADMQLERGEISVQTRRHLGRELVITAGNLRVRPVGTSFRLERSPQRPLSVEVLRGRVEVASKQQAVIVPQRSELTWGRAPGALPHARRQQLKSRLGQARQLVDVAQTTPRGRLKLIGAAGEGIAINGLSLGSSPASLLMPLGRHEVTITAGKQSPSRHVVQLKASADTELELSPPPPTPSPPASTAGASSSTSPARSARPARSLRPKLSLPKGSKASALDIQRELDAIELLLDRGLADRARRQAQTLLQVTGARPFAAPIRTLIAESHLRQRHYQQARRAYDIIFRRHPGVSYGADALFMVASINLEQLNQTLAATRQFKKYLLQYPQGGQREGAYYLLSKALGRLGKPRAASAAARRYLAEFPRGQYVKKLTPFLVAP